MRVEEFVTELRTVVWGVCTAARLVALDQLGVSQLTEKKRRAERCTELIEAAASLQDFGKRYYFGSPVTIQWPEKSDILHDLIKNGKVDSDTLADRMLSFDNSIHESIAGLLEAMQGNELLMAPSALLARLSKLVREGEGAKKLKEMYLLDSTCAPGTKTITGPTFVETDSAFEPTYSLLQTPVSTFGNTARENVPYFWGLAIRESLAADLCALSIFEYDGMPIDFYRDMAKQAWDEMRHSKYFFELACNMMPELESELDESEPVCENLRRFRETGRGLPIPKERNLYEAILNASLIERLILLHRDTETPGIQRIKEKINSSFCLEHPNIVHGLEIVLRDEVTHSRFGNVWLQFLLPDENDREDSIETTELLRGVLLLSAFAHHGDSDLKSLMKHYAQGHRAPVSAVQLPR